MYLELFILILTVLFLVDYFYKRRLNKCFDQADIPGPLSLPLIGTAYNLIGESPQTIFKFQQSLINKYGKNIRIWIMHEGSLLTSDAKMIEAILTSQQVISKNALYGLLDKWLGAGLLLSNGKKWHSRRKIITPTFHFKILEQFVEIFDQQSAVMVQQLYSRADGKTVINMFPVACLAALDIIAETAMGVKIDAQRKPNFPYVQSVQTVSNLTATRFTNPIQRFDSSMCLFYPKDYKKLIKNIKSMHDFSDRVIVDRRALLEQSLVSQQAEAEKDDIGSKRRMALLDVLLQSTIDGKPLTNEDIREEVDTFMFEGHDTTTSGISYTLYLIARHPEVQAKLFQEIREVIGEDKNSPVGMRELGELKYLECVIKESLRLFPPVPIIGRFVTEDVVLNGKFIPAKTNIAILTYHAMRDADYFPEPEKFIPERFSPERKGEVDVFAYTPFSAGPRNCIGQKFAMLEMKSTISKMLRHFELLPLGEEIKPLMNLILRSSTGINLGIKPRVY